MTCFFTFLKFYNFFNKAMTTKCLNVCIFVKLIDNFAADINKCRLYLILDLAPNSTKFPKPDVPE